jgi:inner membrane protein
MHGQRSGIRARCLAPRRGSRRFFWVDPVTHVLLGATLSHAAFGRQLPGRTAALAGGLAALAPDADIFIRSSTDPLLAIEYHRGFTHALAVAPAAAALVAGLWLLRPQWRRRQQWVWLWAACLLAYVSHVLLDAATSYGTQLLWPFSRARFGWDLVSIIDPIFTSALAIGLGWSLARRTRPPAMIALCLAAVYLFLGGVQRGRAVEAQRALASTRGHVPERFEVMPTLANNIVWRAIYVHDDRIWSDRVRVGWFSPAAVRAGWSLPLVRVEDLSPAERQRNRQRSFERFAWFSEGWVARSPTDPSVLGDMRYSLSAEAFDPIWGIRFAGPDAPADVVWVNRTRDRRIEPGELWREIAGEDSRFERTRVARPRNH